MPEKDNLHAGHRARMRGRYLEQGGDGFADHELLEMLLYYAVPRRDTNALAHILIDRFGSLSGVFEASAGDLMQVEGVTENTAALLRLMLDFSRRYYESSVKKRDRTESNVMEEVAERLMARCIGLTQETLFVVCLDNSLRILSVAKVCEGTPDTVSVVCRQVAEQAIRHNAASVILGHNHPRGYALPSRADISTTVQLNQTLAAISIRLLDHIVVAGDDYVSMAQSGMLTAARHNNLGVMTDPWDAPAEDADPPTLE